MNWEILIIYYGPVFLFLFGIVEEILVPLPSAIIAATAGALIIKWPFPLSLLEIAVKVAIPAGLGSTIGSLFLFYLSKKFVDILIDSPFLGVSRREYESMKRKFDSMPNKDIGLATLRAIPIIPFSVITMIAGASRYDIKKYLLFSFIGAFVRDYILGLMGYIVGESVLLLVSRFEHYQSIGAVIAVLLIVGAYAAYKIVKRKG